MVGSTKWQRLVVWPETSSVNLKVKPFTSKLVQRLKRVDKDEAWHEPGLLHFLYQMSMKYKQHSWCKSFAPHVLWLSFAYFLKYTAVGYACGRAPSCWLRRRTITDCPVVVYFKNAYGVFHNSLMKIYHIRKLKRDFVTSGVCSRGMLCTKWLHFVGMLILWSILSIIVSSSFLHVFCSDFCLGRSPLPHIVNPPSRVLSWAELDIPLSRSPW